MAEKRQSSKNVVPHDDAPPFADPLTSPSLNGETAETISPFNVARLRRTPDCESLEVTTHLVTIPVRKPSTEWWIRVHDNPEYHLDTYVLELKEEDRDLYPIARDIWPVLRNEPTVSPRLLLTAVNHRHNVFFWPLRLPDPRGKTNHWNNSAQVASKLAEKGWIRLRADMNLGAYQIDSPPANIIPADPVSLPGSNREIFGAKELCLTAQ